MSWWQSWASFTSARTSNSVVPGADDRSFSAPICCIVVSRCSAAHFRTRTLRCLETREQALRQREKEGQKHRPRSQHAPCHCWAKEAHVLAAILAHCRRLCPQINTKLSLYRGPTCKEEGGILSPWTQLILNFFPKINSEEERSERQFMLTYQRALTLQSCSRIGAYSTCLPLNMQTLEKNQMGGKPCGAWSFRISSNVASLFFEARQEVHLNILLFLKAEERVVVVLAKLSFLEGAYLKLSGTALLF